MNIEAAFKKYNDLTGDVQAAASLVLAEIMLQEREPAGKDLSVNEAAEVMGVCRQTVYNLCASGNLKHRKVGRQIRIKRADLDRIETNQPSEARYW